MKNRNQSLLAAISLVLVVTIAAPAMATQFGVGLHYLRTIEEFDDFDGFSQNDFAIFGSLAFPIAIVRVEGVVEWIPDYIGSDEHLIQPAAYGFLDLGLIYGGLGIGIGYLTGDLGGWANNPWYGLRAGVEFGLGGLALDGFISYRFQSASFSDEIENLNLDAFTIGAQIKFGG
jgi:hypothetical protein